MNLPGERTDQKYGSLYFTRLQRIFQEKYHENRCTLSRFGNNTFDFSALEKRIFYRFLTVSATHNQA